MVSSKPSSSGRKKNRDFACASRFKINEEDIGDDYPLRAFYRPCSNEEVTEDIAIPIDGEITDTIELPVKVLHNWSLYTSDSSLVSLELLPMKPCEGIEVTVFGSGSITEDDGSVFCLDDDDPADHQPSSTGSEFIGLPIMLNEIKEWMVDLGSSMIFMKLRTDTAWYRLGKPSEQYAAWFKPVLKTVKLARSIITLLLEQSRVSRLSFSDVIREVSEFKEDHVAYISSDPEVVETYVVVRAQIILQLFHEFPDQKIKKCAFVAGLTRKLEERGHTKWVVNKKGMMQTSHCQSNLNPRAAMETVAPATSKKK